MKHLYRFFRRDAFKFNRSHVTFNKAASNEKYRLADKVKEGFEIIYKAPMEKYILALSIGSFATVGMMSVAGLYILSEKIALQDLVQTKTWGDRTVVSTNEYELMAFVASFFGFNLAIFLMIRRYPLRIYRNGEKYVAVFEGHVPFVRRHVEFQKGQVEPMTPWGIMPWKEQRYSINGQRSILLDHYFKTPSDLHQMIHEKYKYY